MERWNDGTTEAWNEGMRIMTRAALLISLILIPSFHLSAQVGHDPGTSPYHDILLHPGPVFFFGHLSADRGNAHAGTSNARTFGLRYELPAGRAVQFQFTGAYLQGDRFIIDPRADSASA